MSFESFVREYVLPQIRPAPPPAIPFQDTPEQGVAVLRGLGGKLIDLTFSETSSWSKSRPVEVERVVDVHRVKQKLPDGTVNEENYVDVESVRELTMRGGDGTRTVSRYAPVPEDIHIEPIEVGKKIPNPELPPEPSSSGGAAP